MATEVSLPALGESVTEGTVTRWLKQVGDTVAVDDALVEISTDKVDTEIPSPVAGTLLEIKAEEDETVEVGAELAVIGDEGESADSGSVQVISGPPSLSVSSSRRARSSRMSRSGRASPGGSTAFSDRCTVRSALVKVPVFSPQVAAGRTTSASWAVSVRKRSWTTRNSRSWLRMLRIRSSSGKDTAGLVPVT